MKQFLSKEKYERIYSSKEEFNNLKLNILTRCGEFGRQDSIDYVKMLRVFKERINSKLLAPKKKWIKSIGEIKKTLIIGL